MLAVWSVDADHPIASTCREALAAAHDANRALDELNATRAAAGLPPLHHGIGLHAGSVQYGNVGAHGRLDFTVIGPAVNVASRLEGACARLGRRIVASAELARHCGGLDPAGAIELKGVDGAIEVFTAA